MSEKRRALGRGLGALIPSGPATDRPIDVFFRDQDPVTPPSTVPVDDSGQSASESGPHSGDLSGANGAPSTDSDEPTVEAPPSDDGAAATDTGLRPVPGAEFAEIPLDHIRPNPRQPRTVFDEDELAELVHSIREIGVLQPVVVRRIPTEAQDGEARFELIMGERRWRASREAGKDVVPAIIKVTEEDDLLRDALLENLHRSQLNALEEAAAYQQLLDDFGCTQEELARRIGARSRPQISNTLRLLKLPPLVQRRGGGRGCSAPATRGALLGMSDSAAMGGGWHSGSWLRVSRCAPSRSSSPWVTTTRRRWPGAHPRAGATQAPARRPRR
jgi:ParB family chromosome partitioning protein